MFVSFLNKTQPNYPDLNALNSFPPESVLFYFISASLYVGLDHYLALKETVSGTDAPKTSALQWLQLIDEDLAAQGDLLTLKENEYLESIGPYYYPETNTCFFFYKKPTPETEFLTAQDLELLQSLHDITAPEPSVLTYGKNKKATKRYTRNKEELLRDIRMCQAALNQLGRLQKQINFWEKIQERRQMLVTCPDLLPSEPGNPPHRPENPEESTPEINFLRLALMRKRKRNVKTSYQHDIKVYYIRYREYEKACDRFKAVLENWPTLEEVLRAHCNQDYTRALEKLATAQQYLALLNLILNRSSVHPQYQDAGTLGTFQRYLETGRAEDLQECMNIFEEESLWNELKDGQTRIENTIYLLQNDNTHLQFAQEEIAAYLEECPEKQRKLARA